MSMESFFFLNLVLFIISAKCTSGTNWKVIIRKTVNVLVSSLSLDKPSSWMAVDTALFLLAAGETKEDSTLVGFTESRDKEVCSEFKRCKVQINCCFFFIFN